MVAGGMHDCQGPAWLPGGHVWLQGGHGCRGECVIAGGCMHGIQQDMVCGCQGACVVAGRHAWLLGGVCGCWRVCMAAGGGMCGCGGHAWLQGGHGCGGRGHAQLREGACMGYDEIRSMSGRYASYWNAYLFKYFLKN